MRSQQSAISNKPSARNGEGCGLKAYGFRLSYWQKFWLGLVFGYGLAVAVVCYWIWGVVWVAIVAGLGASAFIWFWGSMCGAAAAERSLGD